MKWYNPLSWFKKYESKEKPEVSEREQARSELQKILQKIEMEKTRLLLQHAGIVRASMNDKLEQIYRFPSKSYKDLEKKQ